MQGGSRVQKKGGAASPIILPRLLDQIGGYLLDKLSQAVCKLPVMVNTSVRADAEMIIPGSSLVVARAVTQSLWLLSTPRKVSASDMVVSCLRGH